MMFLHPWLLSLAGLAAAVVAFYLLRGKPARVQVPALFLWEAGWQQSPTRRFLGKLRHPLSLLLQLIILAVLVLAAAMPERSSRSKSDVVLVLDHRALRGVFATGGETVPEEARKTAESFINHAGEGGEVAVVAAGRSPILVSPFSSSPLLLKERLQALPAGEETGEAETSLTFAKKLAEARDGARVVWIGTEKPADDTVEWAPVTTQKISAQMETFAVRENPAEPGSVRVFYRARNTSPETQTIPYRIERNGVLMDAGNLEIQPGGFVERSFLTRRGARDGQADFFSMKLEGDGVLPDTAYAVLPPVEKIRTLLVSKGNRFLEAALKATPWVEFELLEPSAWRPEFGQSFDVVIADNLPEGLRQSVTAGKPALIFEEGAHDRAFIDWQNERHPVMRNVDLFGLALPNTMNEKTEEETAPLARAGEQVLISARTHEGTRHIMVGFLPQEGDWPLREDFPVFVANALAWLGQRPGDGYELYRTGDVVEAEGPVYFWNGTDEEEKIAEIGAVVLSRAGFYRIEAGGVDRWLAANIFDEQKPSITDEPVANPAKRSGWPWWRWLAILAIALLAAEWILFRRRITE